MMQPCWTRGYQNMHIFFNTFMSDHPKFVWTTQRTNYQLSGPLGDAGCQQPVWRNYNQIWVDQTNKGSLTVCAAWGTATPDLGGPDEIKFFLQYVWRETRRQVICLREDALAFTPQAISCIVARVQHAKILMGSSRSHKLAWPNGSGSLGPIYWQCKATSRNGVKAPVHFLSTQWICMMPRLTSHMV